MSALAEQMYDALQALLTARLLKLPEEVVSPLETQYRRLKCQFDIAMENIE